MKTEISAYLYNKKLQKVLQSVPEYVKIIQWAQNPIKYKKGKDSKWSLSSLEFLLMFLTVTLLVYFIVPLKARNIVLLIVSLIFYGWGEPVYVFLMIFTIAVDYIFGLLVERNLKKDDRKRAKTCLVLSIVINLSILGFFKYYDFFVSNLRLIPGLSGLPLLGLSLPIGISFYTFQALSYVIDVYRGDTGAQHNAAAFGAYVTLYPQLIAGPIVRYKDVDDQLTEREHSVPLFADGVRTLRRRNRARKSSSPTWQGNSGNTSKRPPNRRTHSRRRVARNALLHLPDLLRLLRILRHGNRSRKDDRLPVPRKLQLSVHIEKHNRILAPLAHLARHMVP